MKRELLTNSTVPNKENDYYQTHVQLLMDSFFRCTGYPLLKSSSEGVALAQEIFTAPFVLISHGIEAEPIFNYANLCALSLFAMSWDEFTQLPSKYSAEQPNREERARLLAEVQSRGFINNYSGIRIAKDGRRFMIDKAIVWNLTDAQGTMLGQAAYFKDWKEL